MQRTRCIVYVVNIRRLKFAAARGVKDLVRIHQAAMGGRFRGRIHVHVDETTQRADDNRHRSLCGGIRNWSVNVVAGSRHGVRDDAGGCANVELDDESGRAARQKGAVGADDRVHRRHRLRLRAVRGRAQGYVRGAGRQRIADGDVREGAVAEVLNNDRRGDDAVLSNAGRAVRLGDDELAAGNSRRIRSNRDLVVRQVSKSCCVHEDGADRRIRRNKDGR